MFETFAALGIDKVLADALANANVALGGAVFISVLNLLANAARGNGNMSLPASVGLGAAHIALAPALSCGVGPIPALSLAGAGRGW